MNYSGKKEIKERGLIRLSALIFLLAGLFIFNQAPGSAASADAIAVRVMPNLKQLSPERWYALSVKNPGSPQDLTVDGYRAVRDGRTVYVSAANVDLTNKKFYANIYIISYDQRAEDRTIDIFGRLLTHWKFNINLNPEQKESARRDTVRLADLELMNGLLKKYQSENNGAGPELAAGSYLAGFSVSVWPSWRETLSAALGANLPLDPVNALAPCPSYNNQATCWDENNKNFYFNFSGQEPSINSSPVYWYHNAEFRVNLEFKFPV